jgi:hypothetical protein
LVFKRTVDGARKLRYQELAKIERSNQYSFSFFSMSLSDLCGGGRRSGCSQNVSTCRRRITGWLYYDVVVSRVKRLHQQRVLAASAVVVRRHNIALAIQQYHESIQVFGLDAKGQNLRCIGHIQSINVRKRFVVPGTGSE